jgi:predicted Rossmann fold flavoprotein
MSNEEKYDLIVIGAGAAGIVAAGTAANNGAKVLVLEKMRSAGRKMLISGKGRCNITNDSYTSNHFKQHHPKSKYLKNAFKNFFKEDILEILDSQNVEYKTERGDRVFPVSDKSKDVLDALLRWGIYKKVKLETHSDVKKVITKNKTVVGVEYEQEGRRKQAKADAVIIATGGKSYPLTGSTGDGYRLAKELGHSIITPLPALVPIETKGNLAQSLMGLALKNVNASLWINGKKHSEEFGEMLFTHFGLSGPIILTLSRDVVLAIENGDKLEISIDLKPALDDKKLDNRLIRDLDANGKKYIENIFKLWMPSKLIKPMLNICGIDTSKLGNQIKAEDRKQIRLRLKDFRFEISAYRPFKEAIITQGGINTDEVSSKTMESKLVQGLYFAGEVLNIDANTGGYNFQIAYSTGSLAANSAIKS